MGNGDGPASPAEDRRRINQTGSPRLGQPPAWACTITDAFCGFKAYRVERAGQRSTSNVDGYAIPLQQWVQFAAATACAIKEVPIRLIYNDPNRSFGGKLDDPELRWQHYQEIFEQEVARLADRLPASALAGGVPPQNATQGEAAEPVASACSPCS